MAAPLRSLSLSGQGPEGGAGEPGAAGLGWFSRPTVLEAKFYSDVCSKLRAEFGVRAQLGEGALEPLAGASLITQAVLLTWHGVSGTPIIRGNSCDSCYCRGQS